METQLIDFRTEGFDKLTFRASSFGYIMVDPREKSPAQKIEELTDDVVKLRIKRDETKSKETLAYGKILESISKKTAEIKRLEPLKEAPHLSDGCKSHLSDVFTACMYGRREDIESRYLAKGLAVEEDVITMYSLHTGNNHRKNKIRKSNEFFEGEIDFTDGFDRILDSKANWSIFQFVRAKSKKLDKIYEWQQRVYMALWDKPKARVVHGLVNTPEHFVVQEEKKLLDNFVGSKGDYEMACLELRKNHTYDDIPLEEKLHFFDIERDLELEKKMESRVIECRKYLNNLLNNKVVPIDEEEEN